MKWNSGSTSIKDFLRVRNIGDFLEIDYLVSQTGSTVNYENSIYFLFWSSVPRFGGGDKKTTFRNALTVLSIRDAAHDWTQCLKIAQKLSYLSFANFGLLHQFLSN